jgi:hypothetical protein
LEGKRDFGAQPDLRETAAARAVRRFHRKYRCIRDRMKLAISRHRIFALIPSCLSALRIAVVATSIRWGYEAGMKFQISMRHLRILTMLAASAVTLPAAAQEREAEPPLKSRDAKTAEAAAPTVDLKIEGVRNGLQIRVLPKDERLTPEGPKSTSCKEDCELKLPAGSYTLIATQVERQETPGADLAAQPEVTMSEPDAGASRRRLGHALGASGVVATVIGSYLVIAALVARPTTHGEFLTGLDEYFYGGLAGIGVGTGLMIGGFSLAAANRATPLAVDRMPTVVQRRPTDVGVSLTTTF